MFLRIYQYYNRMYRTVKDFGSLVPRSLSKLISHTLMARSPKSIKRLFDSHKLVKGWRSDIPLLCRNIR